MERLIQQRLGIGNRCAFSVRLKISSTNNDVVDQELIVRALILKTIALGFLLALLPARIVALRAAEPAAEDLEFFEKRVRPILAEHCGECHAGAGDKVKGGLNLGSRETILQGGDSGPAAIAGDPEKSLLVQAVGYDNEQLQMPPAGKLPPAAIADLRDWVRRGLPFPKNASAPVARRGVDLEQGRKHWAFQPLQSTSPPTLSPPTQLGPTPDWPKRRIDTYIAVAQAQRGGRASSPASRAVLIRRVSFDLVGLPPTAEEKEHFESDQSPDAYERLIDRLLSSPHYGERWGRHWLDLARYCDIPEPWRVGSARAWLYRDWIVQAINGDLPYNDFIRKQLAADLLPGFEPPEAAALGFLGLSPTYWKELKLDHKVIKQVVAEEWEERIDAIGGTFLGLTIACARCHDHKFDPLTTLDYYALAGVLASIRVDEQPIIAADLAAAAQRGRDQVKDLLQQIDKLKMLKPLPADLAKQIESLQQRIDQTKRETPHYDTPLAFGVMEASLHVSPDGPNRTKLEYKPDQPQDVCVQVRGSAANPGAVAPRRFPAVLAKDPSATFRQGSGRRELAEAIVTDAAPLTARVFVNRVWKQHFGRGLVNTPCNFGVQGERPTHPELLDDLAARFIEHGWSLKWLHRQLTLSATYQQTSQADEQQVAADPDNVYLGRMSVRRLEVEAWRDAMLAAAGDLDESLGGDSRELTDANNRRRTLYGTVKRRELSDLLRLHDFPDPVTHSTGRVPTTSPIQQLFVLNSPYMEQRSAALLARLQAEAGPDAPQQRIRRAYELLLGRQPTGDELTAAETFFRDAVAEGVSSETTWREYCQALLAGNELLFVD